MKRKVLKYIGKRNLLGIVFEYFKDEDGYIYALHKDLEMIGYEDLEDFDIELMFDDGGSVEIKRFKNPRVMNINDFEIVYSE